VILDQNNIQYIESRVFDNFFKMNEKNIVYISNNPLNCDDNDQFKWLLDKKSTLKERLIDAICRNGSRLWDLGQF